MNQSADFHLPDEILSVIPTDPYDQLDLARKITSLAIASRVSKLESETGRLRKTISEKDRTIEELQSKLSQLQSLFHEADSTLRATLEENAKLSKERDSLAQTTKKLARDLSKLETFKRHLMQSLSDDSSSQAETVDIRTCDQTVPKPPIWKDNGSFSYTSSTSVSGFTEMATTAQSVPSISEHKITTFISPRFTPYATPTVTSTVGSPKGYSTLGSPNMTSGATSPTKTRFEGYTSMSPWYSSSQQSSAASSPPRGRSLSGRTPRIDGKEFFRQVRSRLSYEQFAAFLANIKELNAHRQSREETLKKAEEIFGTENKDLYLSFQGLLNRNVR